MEVRCTVGGFLRKMELICWRHTCKGIKPQRQIPGVTVFSANKHYSRSHAEAGSSLLFYLLSVRMSTHKIWTWIISESLHPLLPVIWAELILGRFLKSRKIQNSPGLWQTRVTWNNRFPMFSLLILDKKRPFTNKQRGDGLRWNHELTSGWIRIVSMTVSPLDFAIFSVTEELSSFTFG